MVREIPCSEDWKDSAWLYLTWGTMAALGYVGGIEDRPQGLIFVVFFLCCFHAVQVWWTKRTKEQETVKVEEKTGGSGERNREEASG